MKTLLGFMFAAMSMTAAWGQSVPDPLNRAQLRANPDDTLLAALGEETLACLGRVTTRDYRVNPDGVLERAFDACTKRDTGALERIDALLGVQQSREGQKDKLAGRFAAVWSRAARTFPSGLVTQCPRWTLLHVIDAPTEERVAHFAAKEGAAGIGKEYRWYRVSSPQCGSNGFCAVFQAMLCGAGYSNQFIVWTDPASSSVIVDPVWWLLNDDDGDEDGALSNPVYKHPMSHYGDVPGARYGSLRRAGEQCTRYDEISKKHYVHYLHPIECAPGWKCMTYCMSAP